MHKPPPNLPLNQGGGEFECEFEEITKSFFDKIRFDGVYSEGLDEAYEAV
jgi:hypothetical protein